MNHVEKSMRRDWSPSELRAMGFPVPDSFRWRGFEFFATADPFVRVVVVEAEDGSTSRIENDDRANVPWSEMLARVAAG